MYSNIWIYNIPIYLPPLSLISREDSYTGQYLIHMEQKQLDTSLVHIFTHSMYVLPNKLFILQYIFIYCVPLAFLYFPPQECHITGSGYHTIIISQMNKLLITLLACTQHQIVPLWSYLYES